MVAECPLLAMPTLLLQAGTVLQDRGARRSAGVGSVYTLSFLCVCHTFTPLLRIPSAHWNHQQSCPSQQIPQHLLHADTSPRSPRPGLTRGIHSCLQFAMEHLAPAPHPPSGQVTAKSLTGCPASELACTRPAQPAHLPASWRKTRLLVMAATALGAKTGLDTFLCPHTSVLLASHSPQHYFLRSLTPPQTPPRLTHTCRGTPSFTPHLPPHVALTPHARTRSPPFFFPTPVSQVPTHSPLHRRPH